MLDLGTRKNAQSCACFEDRWSFKTVHFSMQEAPAIFPDRLIAIRGTVENMSAAEAAISSLLRECVEKHNIQSSLVS
jgi:insulin-like growth factor 2 mRNA-binding protein 1